MREPDFHLPGYLMRWYLIPRNRFCNLYLHRIYGSDARVVHDHPWWSISICLCGRMIEHFGIGGQRSRRIHRFVPILRSPVWLHWLEIVDGRPVWTLFLTGPYLRDWGFFVPGRGWISHREYRQDL